jgi:hypothetical protein
MSDPGLRIGQLESSHPLEIGDRAFAGKKFVERVGVDDSVRCEASAQQSVSDQRSATLKGRPA